MKKISIIVPVYNTEKYLSKCIDSILCQTYNNFELLLIDDGSTDNSLSICNSFLYDKRVNIFHEKNKGLSKARNTGISKATGEYICFIDSDDYVKEDYLFKLVSLIEEYNADMAQCKFIKIYGDCTELPENDEETVDVLDGKDILNEYFNQKNTHNKINHNVWNKIYVKSLFNGISFTEDIVYEDLDIMYKLLRKTNKFVSTSKIEYLYNKTNTGSIIHKYSVQYALNKYEIINRMKKIFINDYEVVDSFRAFLVNQLIAAYEESFDLENDDKVLEIRKKLKNQIIEDSKISDVGIIESLKLKIRILFPRLQKKYKNLISKNGRNHK